MAKVFPQKGFLMGWSRILLRKTKAHKQFDSMKSLLRLGLVTPEPLGVQTFHPGRGAYEGALLYRYVEGVQEVSEALQGPLRKTILTHLVRELAVMANGGSPTTRAPPRWPPPPCSPQGRGLRVLLNHMTLSWMPTGPSWV